MKLSPGLLVVQVDGLSHRHLQEAMDRGLMPNLKERLDQGQLVETPWHCGLPSQTVVVQGGLLYGSRELPGNQWYDKSTGEVWDTVSLNHADEIDAALTASGRPLIEGGSSYLTPMSGGADERRFNISEIAEAKEKGGTRGALRELGGDLLSLSRSLARHPIETAKTAVHFVGKTIDEARRRRRTGLEPEGLKDKVVKPLEAAFKEAYLTDAAAQQMADRIAQGEPVMYVDFPNFDEMSHTYGPREAFDALPSVDRNLKTLFQAIDEAERPYNVVLLSDHGQVGSAPFHELYGTSLADFTLGLLPAGSPGSPLEVPEEELPFESLLPHRDDCLSDAGNGRVVSLDFGSGAHLYFPELAGSCSRPQLAASFPGLLPGLVAHPGIAFVVTRDGGATVIEGKSGTLRLEANGQQTVTGQSPLADWEFPDIAASQLHSMAHRDHGGDVLVFGEKVGDQLVDFSLRGFRGLHGGIGFGQDEPFLAYTPGMALNPATYRHAADLHGELYPYRPADA